MSTLFEYRYPRACGHDDEGNVFALSEFDGDLWVSCDGRGVRIPRQGYRALHEAMQRHGGGIYLDASWASSADPAEAPASPPFVSSEVETPQRPQCATDPFIVMKTALMDASPALAAIAPMEDIDKLAEAACAAYGRHQTGEAYGLPPYEPPTCGTGHLVAERTLRLLAKGTPFDALPGGDAIRELASLVEQAGVAFAREALARDTKPFLLDEDIPF